MAFGKRNRGKQPIDKGPKRNSDIKIPEVRVIGDDGKMLGVISTSEAIEMAKEKGLDLVEVNPNGSPPVAKLIDYGKYKYELKKKQQESKKKQTTVVLKEVQFRPKIDKHDFEFKVKHIEKFIGEGNKVKVCITFRGREMAHPEMADVLIAKLRELTSEYAVVDSEPKREGRRMIMMLSPSKSK